MSIITKVIIDDIEHNVLKYNWSFNQKADKNGKPNSTPTGGLIKITIETTGNPLFNEWAINQNMMKYVQVVQSPSSRITRNRVIEFYDSICVSIDDDFDGVNNQPMSTTVTISSPLIVLDGTVIMEKYWKVTDLEQQTPNNTTSTEPQIIGYYITNTENERISEYFAGDTIILNVETENCLGKLISLNLFDKEYDFKHNGIILKNDILKDYEINSDLEQITLEVVEEETIE